MFKESREAQTVITIVSTFAFVTLISGGNPDDLKEVVLAAFQAIEASVWPTAFITIVDKFIDKFGGKN